MPIPHPTHTDDKDPGASLVWTLSWAGPLRLKPGVTITGSSWSVEGPANEDPVEIEVEDEGYTANETWCRVSGGTNGQTYDVSNTVLFSNEETDVRTIQIRIRRF